MGLKVIATYGMKEKEDLLQKIFGISRKHIVNSRSHRYETDAIRITQGKGVDVLTNDQAGDDLKENWARLATYGGTVDISR